jgi:hypothetical protein
MKSIFNKTEQEEIRQRLEKLHPGTQALWGKMNVAQMLAHCTGGMHMPMGDIEIKNLPWAIRLIGKLVKIRAMSSKPFDKNSPTAKELKNYPADSDFNKEKEEFLKALEKISKGESVIMRKVHPFFGSLTAQEWGRLNYKHTDHHFQQFGV